MNIDRFTEKAQEAISQAKQLTEIRMPDETSCSTCHNGRLGLPDALARDLLDKLK